MSKTTFSDLNGTQITIENSGRVKSTYSIYHTSDADNVNSLAHIELNEYQAKILINSLRNLIESDS